MSRTARTPRSAPAASDEGANSKNVSAPTKTATKALGGRPQSITRRAQRSGFMKQVSPGRRFDPMNYTREFPSGMTSSSVGRHLQTATAVELPFSRPVHYAIGRRSVHGTKER